MLQLISSVETFAEFRCCLFAEPDQRGFTLIWPAEFEEGTRHFHSLMEAFWYARGLADFGEMNIYNSRGALIHRMHLHRGASIAIAGGSEREGWRVNAHAGA